MPSPIRKIVAGSQRMTLILVVTAAAVLIAATAIMIYQIRAPRITKINYSELYQIAETGSAVSLTIESDTLTVKSTQGTSLQATVTSDAIRQGLVEQFRKKNVPIEFQPVQTTWTTTLLTWAAPFVTVLVLGFIGWRVYAGMNGGVGSFGIPNQNGKQS